MGELMGMGSGVDAEEFVEKGVRKEAVDELVSRAEGLIQRVGEEYKSTFLTEYKRLMTARVGLRVFKSEDFEGLFTELLDTMEALELDFNHFFRRLSHISVAELETDEQRKAKARVFFHDEGVTGLGHNDDAARTRIASWLEKWRTRVYEDWGPDGDDTARQEAMKSVNPNFIPRGWVLDELIRRVEKGGEREILDKVMNMALHPFEEKWGWDEKEEARFCGDVPQPDRAMQCSCSS
jgi:uncharacterized protein YdiU (UPF0061 family)